MRRFVVLLLVCALAMAFLAFAGPADAAPRGQLVAALGGGCQVPIGALATARGDGVLHLDAVVTSLDGAIALRAADEGSLSDPSELGARVADDQFAVGVGEENRIGDGVDDREQQRALATELPNLLGEAAPAPNLIELLAEHGDKPRGIRRQAVGRSQEQQPECRVLHGPQRDRRERAAAERRAADGLEDILVSHGALTRAGPSRV